MQDISEEIENITLASLHNCEVETSNTIINLSTMCLKIASKNIRSIYKNMDSLLAQLAKFSFDYDIIILTECWLDISMDGYITNFTQKCRNQNDGFIIYVKEHIKCVVKEPDPIGANFLTLKLDPNIFILATYRFPSYKFIESFLNSLSDIISPVSSCETIVMICAVNIDIKQSNTDRYSETYLNLIAVLGILPAHTCPTRIL